MIYPSQTSMRLTFFIPTVTSLFLQEAFSSPPFLSCSHTSFSCILSMLNFIAGSYNWLTQPLLRWECDKTARSQFCSPLFCPLFFTFVTFVTVLISSPFEKVLRHHPRHHLGHQIWHMWEEIWAEDRQRSLCRSPDPPSASASHSGRDHETSLRFKLTSSRVASESKGITTVLLKPAYSVMSLLLITSVSLFLVNT